MKRVIVNYLQDTFIPRSPDHFNDEEVEIYSVNKEYDKKAKNDELYGGKFNDGNIVIEEVQDINPQDFENSRIGAHRVLKNRQIQLIGIGGTIGTALFVSIGGALNKGGPLSLLLGYSLWCIPVYFITLCCAEMVPYMPIPSPFIRMAGEFVDDALEVTAGWNFWFLECALIPFEVTAFNTVLHFWADDYSPAIPLAVQILFYFLINVVAVKWYGETEFYLSLGKVILAVGLMIFTFVTMIGGNPKHDAYGFRNWKVSDGPMLEYIATGSLGRFEGFLACMIIACFTICGPEYVSMAASECVNPRKTLPSAYKQVIYRLSFFFVGGSFCVATVCAYNDPSLLVALKEGSPGAGSSPYIVAMTNLNIKVLPHIVNALLLTAAFSAGNSYTFCSARALYGLALDHKAPRIFTHCSRSGVPIYCVLVSNCWALLSFLQLGETAQTVLDWIVNLVTTCQLINYSIIAVTYIHFYRACKVQGFNRDLLPYKSKFQPYISYAAAVIFFLMTWIAGYTVFLPGSWSTKTFLFNYLMIFVDIGIFIFWKLLKRTKYKKPSEVDLYFGTKEVDDYYKWYNETQRNDIKSTKKSRLTQCYRSFLKVMFGN